jgi:hypothetical protein
VFVRRLAKEMEGGGGKLNERYLAELGVPKDKQAEFSKYVLSKNDGMLTAGDMAGADGRPVPHSCSPLHAAVDHAAGRDAAPWLDGAPAGLHRRAAPVVQLRLLRERAEAQRPARQGSRHRRRLHHARARAAAHAQC